MIQTAKLKTGDRIYVVGQVKVVKTCVLVPKTDLHDIVFEDGYKLRECQNKQWAEAPNAGPT